MTRDLSFQERMPVKTLDELVFAQHIQEIERKHGREPVHLHLDMPTVVCLIGQVQLALRHPANTGASAQHIRDTIDRIIDSVDRESPGIGQFLRRGYDSNYDVPGLHK